MALRVCMNTQINIDKKAATIPITLMLAIALWSMFAKIIKSVMERKVAKIQLVKVGMAS